MPYSSIEDLPNSIQTHLPLHAQEIYLGAFNSAWTQYAHRSSEQRESTAHRVAWAAVKRKYQKSGDRWIPLEPTRRVGRS
ncbi:ChaB family protein [Bradyrhizobium sp.]|uniref:ChaB family protein n=1 Tax=Bradyrhizobium sp. TaxID=376 RepID=UPI0025C193BD|nr:ChaB family protein [Bradyrhizobium sp.]